MTIKIPTLKDFRLILKALTIYDLVNLQDNDFDSALKTVKDAEFQEEELKETYRKVLEVVSDYSFGTVKDAEE